LGHLVSTLAFFTPQSGGSSNANQIDGLYKITLVIALVIFALVEAGLLYALLAISLIISLFGIFPSPT
jgi:hypothetical protein